jgi:hypothetical protein
VSTGHILKKFTTSQVLSAFLGVFVAVLLMGFSSIWPTNTSWLSSGDSAAGQVAWNYFRHTSLSQWPPTFIPNYGIGWSTYFTGAGGNVLVGLPLKYLNFLLPSDFQYVGVWTVICFALQGYFAAKIVNLYCTSKSLTVLFAANFIIAPVFIFRIGMMSHSQLGAQWILLCVIYFFLNQNKKIWQWALLVAVSHCIELYMSAMVLVIIGGYFLSKVISSNNRQEIVNAAKILVSSIFTSFVLLWVLGFFSLPGGLKGNGFFRYSTTALFDPRISGVSSASFIFNALKHLPNRFTTTFDGESFLYLGIGFTSLSIFFLGVSWRRFTRKLQWPHVWLLLVCIGLFLVGLSRTVSIGPVEFTYWWPAFLEDLRQTFRAATRFGWPLYYLIYIAVSVRVIDFSIALNKKLIFASVLLLINIVDQSPLYFSTAVFYRTESENSDFNTDEVEKLFGSYSSINFVPVFDLQEDRSTAVPSELLWREGASFYEILLISSKFNLKSNFAYQSRPVGNIIENENAKLYERLNAGSINEGELYVFKGLDEAIKFAEKFSENVISFSYRNNYFVGLPN